MNANHSRVFPIKLTLAAALLSPVAWSNAQESVDAFPVFESYIKVTGQAAAISGNGAAYQTRARQPENGGAGIEDLHYSRDTKETSFVLDGRALAGVEDYLARVSMS